MLEAEFLGPLDSSKWGLKMKKSLGFSARVGSLGIAIAIVLGGVFVSSVAASAAEKPSLPNGWVLYAADCGSATGQVYSVDLLTGVATAIGEPGLNPKSVCPTQGHFDSVTGNIYLPNGFTDGPNNLTATVNVETGVITPLPGATTTPTGAIAGDDEGNLYAFVDRGPNVEVFRIDPLTGDQSASPIANTVVSGYFNNYTFAFNPTDKKFYTLDWDNNEFVTLDPLTAVVTRTGKFIDTSKTVDTTPNPYSLAFDSNGIAWLQDDLYPASGLSYVAIDLATEETWLMFNPMVNETLYPNGGAYAMSFWLVPGAEEEGDAGGDSGNESGSALPETGSTINGALVFGALSAVMVGIGLSAGRRRLSQN